MASTEIHTPEEAQELVETFVAHHPEYALDTLHFRQGTNSFVFRGCYRGEVALYKVSIRGSTAREAKMLQYFEPSGLVPRLFHVEDNFVIEEFVEGELWTERIRAGAGATPELLNSVGQAFLRFTESAQQYPGLEAATFARNVTLTLETANLLLQLHSDVYSDDIFPHTLATVLAHRDQFVNEPPSLYNYDCGPDNILLRDERFTRFVDLEGLQRTQTS